MAAEESTPRDFSFVEARIDAELIELYSAFEEVIPDLVESTDPDFIRETVLAFLRAAYAGGAYNPLVVPELKKLLREGTGEA